MTATINYRKLYTLWITNEFFSPGRPDWAAGWRERGTVRQLIELARDAKRHAGGCDVATRFIGAAPVSGKSIFDLESDLHVVAAMAAKGGR